jgi:hypothetical protein
MIETETRAPLGLGDWGSHSLRLEFEPQSRGGALLDPEEGLAPVAMSGGLVGSVVDRYGLPASARVLIRDRHRAVIKECYTGGPRAASAGGRFEVWGLPTGTYVVEITAPGFASEVRHGVQIEAPCATNLGAIRMTRADSPSITVHPRREESLPFLRLTAPRS